MPKQPNRSLIPSLIDDAARRKEYSGEVAAAMLFADISGFTTLTQALMEHGVEGAEIMAGLINRVFTPAIEAIEQMGGFISGFAGDAFSAIFQNQAIAALVAAERIQRQFEERGLQHTKFGEFPLSIHIGVSYGSVEWRVIPSSQQHAYWFAGPAIDQSSDCERRAGAGQVVFDQHLLSQLTNSDKLDYQTLPDGYLLLTGVPETAPAPISFKPLIHQEKFIPKTVLQMKDAGEFREVLACFINLSTDDPADIISLMITLCHKLGGYFKEIEYGDKGWVVVVLFGAPTTQDKMAQRAAEFALEVKNICQSNCRIGLTLGRVFAGFVGSSKRCTYAAVGSSVNLAARLMTSAQWGEILVGPLLISELQDRYEIASAGLLTLKGIAVPLTSHSLVERKKFASQREFGGQMVGREAELEQLHNLANPIFEGRFAGIVNIYGAAGMGKSRLATESTDGLRKKAQVCLLQCDGILRQPYHPWVYFIRQLFEDTSAGTVEERRVRFRKNWAVFADRISALPASGSMTKELERIESIIAALLGLEWVNSVYTSLPGKDKPVVTRFAIKSLIRALALQRPVVLLLEDLHWIDAESSAVFTVFTREISDVPMLVITVSRYNDDGSKPVLPVDKSVLQASLELNSLNGAETGQLTASVLGMPAEDELVQFLFGRSEGNPFYTEQIALYLKETSGIEVRGEKYALKTRTIDLPLGIDSLLIARLDRLEAGLKDVVQTASVIGREFAVQVLRELLLRYHHITRSKIAFTRAKIEPNLKRGEEGRVWNAASEIAYIFSHSLLRDAAYNMQLKKRLTELHRLTAETLLKLFPADKEMFFEVAEHYAEAGDTEIATEYYDKAGDHLKDTFKFDKALECYQNALAFRHATLGEEHLAIARLITKIGATHYGRGDYEQSLINHTKALTIRLGILGKNHPDTAQSYADIAVIYNLQGHYDKALEHYQQALEIRQKTLGEKHPEAAWVQNHIGGIYWSRGDYDTALVHCLKALEIYNGSLGRVHPDSAMACINIGSAYWSKRELEPALEYYTKALKIHLEALGERNPTTALDYLYLGVIAQSEKRYDEALEYYSKTLGIQLETIGDQHPATAATYLNIGNAWWSKDDYDRALEFYAKALKIKLESLGEKHPDIARSFINIGSAYWSKGDFDRAVEYYTDSLNLRLEILGEKHPDTASSYFHLGSAHSSKENYAAALEEHEKALKIRLGTIGEKHPHTSLSYQAVITSSLEMKDYARSDNYLLQWEAVSRKHQLTGYAFDLEFLKARLAFAERPDATVIEQILSLKTSDLAPEQTADIHFEAARMQRALGLPDVENSIKAVRLYSELYAKSPKIEYRKRLKALGR